ncbi:MAG TPA: hypothetical protein VIG80_13175 [Bacillaceae bacterium]
MNKRTLLILAFTVAIIGIWGARMYHVNAGVARTYEIEKRMPGDAIHLDHAELKVEDISYGKAKNGLIPVTVNMKLTNSGEKETSVLIIVESKLAYGLEYYQTMDGEYDPELLRHLPAGTSAPVTLTFHIPPKHKDKSAVLYIDPSLYKDQVNAYYQKGKRYGIAVEI